MNNCIRRYTEDGITVDAAIKACKAAYGRRD